MISYNLPMQDYLDMPHESSTGLKTILLSAKDYLWNKTKIRKETGAKTLGTAIHCAVLEPAEFEHRYALMLEDKGPRNKGEGYQSWKEMQLSNKGKICLGFEDSSKVIAIIDAARKHRGLQSILFSGHSEVTAWYQYNEKFGLKARTDWLADEGILWDVKTTSDAMDDFSLMRTVRKYGYHFQAAHHTNVFSQYKAIKGFGWIFISTGYPATHIITRRCPDDLLREGERDHMQALDILTDNLESLEWRGLDDEIHELAPGKFYD